MSRRDLANVESLLINRDVAPFNVEVFPATVTGSREVENAVHAPTLDRKVAERDAAVRRLTAR